MRTDPKAPGPARIDMARVLSRKELATMKRHGYVSRCEGQLYMLSLDKETGATVLEPVEVLR
jgi:hypothetical protein